MRMAAKLTGFVILALIVIGIIATVIVRMREAANRARCQDHFRQVGWFALWDYTDRQLVFPGGRDVPNVPLQLPDKMLPPPDRLFPPGTLANPKLAPEERLSWQVILLPQLGNEPLRRKIDLNQGWQAPSNSEAIRTLMPLYVCPTAYEPAQPETPARTNYLGMAGYGVDSPKLPLTDPRAGFFRYDAPTKTGALVRGFSYTLTIIETTTDIGPWAAGGPSTVRGFDPQPASFIGPGLQFGGAHRDGAYASFADGSVRFLRSDMSTNAFGLLVTLADRGPKDE
jgi:hypothetical protein